MKLLIYSHFFPPSVGGVETIVLSLATWLAALRDSKGAPQFEITLVTQTPAAKDDDRAIAFPVFRKPGLLKLWRLIRKSDLIHVAGPALAPLILARLSRKPFVIEHHGYQATCPNGLLFHHPTGTACRGHFQAGEYRECLKCNSLNEGTAKNLWLLLSAFLRRAASRRASANIAPSSHVATRQGLPRTITIAHGIEDPCIVPAASFTADCVNPKGFAYLGRLVMEKGLSILLEAARLLRAEGHELHLLLIGDGPDRPRLENEIKTLGLESVVRILGFLPRNDLDLALRPIGTLIIPTIMEETAGLAAIEQMMRGRLVIASAVGGLQEVVGDAGLTFPPGDAAALAACMKKVLHQPALVNTLGAQARDRAKALFLLERMIQDHATLYRETVQH